MKKTMIATACLLAAALLLAVSCAEGKAAMTLDGREISVNIYELYLSRQKGALCTAYCYGSKATHPEFWDTVYSKEGGTYNEYWTEVVKRRVKNLLAGEVMFDEEKLSLPDAYVREIEDRLGELVIGDGDGSKTVLNSVLSDYGVNYNMLKKAYIIDAKTDYLKKHLYGEKLSKVSKELKEEFFEDNFVRFKQIFLPNYRYVYEKDKNGDTIYYDKAAAGSAKGKILYDKKNGKPRYDEKGEAFRDANGSVIYYAENGRIAYDAEKGVPSPLYDGGKEKTERYSDEEIREIKKRAEDLRASTKRGDFDEFERKAKKYGDAETRNEWPNGIYLSLNATYDYKWLTDIADKLAKTETGEISVVESEKGYHVIMKYDLEEGAYEKEENEVWLESKDRGVSFSFDLSERLFEERCKRYSERTEVNEKVVSSVDMKTVRPNFYY